MDRPKHQQRVRQNSKIFFALCLNAGLLAAILIAVVSKDGRSNFPTLLSPAFAQQPSVGSVGGVVVMPAQLSPNTWGCYLMDSNAQSLCVYQYSPGEKMLRLSAARNFRYDSQLKNFNTLPAPMDVKDLVERELQPPRAEPILPKSPEKQ